MDLTLAQNPAMIAASTAKKRRNKLSEKTSNPLHKDSDLAKYQLQLGYPTSCEPQCYFFADDCQEVECAKLGEFTKPIDIDPMMIMLMSTKPQVKSRSAGEVNHWSSSKISKKSVSWKKLPFSRKSLNGSWIWPAQHKWHTPFGLEFAAPGRFSHNLHLGRVTPPTKARQTSEAT